MSEYGKFIGFVGIYIKVGSEGVYIFMLDMKVKKIVEVKVVVKIENFIYLNVSKDNKYFYIVIKEGEKGGVVVFKIDLNIG